MYRDLDHVERCGFLHSVQHVLNNIFEVFLDIANFWPFLLYFMGIFGKKILKLLKMERNWCYLIEQASEMSKITLSVIVYAPCPSKTIIKTNKKQMNSSADTFLLNDPLFFPCFLLSSFLPPFPLFFLLFAVRTRFSYSQESQTFFLW